MKEPIWLPLGLVLAIHETQLRRFGGPSGVRDLGALESALGRPINRWAYEQSNLAGLAAAYAFGIARNHPFVDGNKRVALISFVTFLGLNGVVIKSHGGTDLEGFAAAIDMGYSMVRHELLGKIGQMLHSHAQAAPDAKALGGAAS